MRFVTRDMAICVLSGSMASENVEVESESSVDKHPLRVYRFCVKPFSPAGDLDADPDILPFNPMTRVYVARQQDEG